MENDTPEHTLLKLPNVKVGIGLILTRIESMTSSHGPIGSFVVKYSQTEPFEISVELGEYVVFSALGFIKLPVPLEPHVALVAVPPNEPFNNTFEPVHIEVSLPALTNGVPSKIIDASSSTTGHGDIMPFAVSVR